MKKHSDNLEQAQFATDNYILNSLPKKEYERLLPNLEPVALSLGQYLYRAEGIIDYAYFLNYAMVSVIATTIEGQTAEIGVIGRQGLVGMEALMGTNQTLHDNLVQHADSAHRIKISILRDEFNRGGELNKLLLNFARLLMLQIGQTALCNRLHTVEERLSRWLLLCRDRAGTNKLQLTQEFLSIMLGTNRATVTISAILLQSSGFIKYSRGRITIVDEAGLEEFACECYKIVKNEYDRSTT